MNLYTVYPCDDYAYYVFAESRNKAKYMCVNHMNDEEAYIDMRVYLMKKDVGGKPAVIDCPEDPENERVTALGYNFYNEDGREI